MFISACEQGWLYKEMYPSKVGCRDSTACNYNPNAEYDYDEECEYADRNYDCDGNCIEIVDCDGVCGGYNLPDENYDCDGNCLTYFDCDSVCNGDATLDACGECDNDPTDDCPQECEGKIVIGSGSCRICFDWSWTWEEFEYGYFDGRVLNHFVILNAGTENITGISLYIEYQGPNYITSTGHPYISSISIPPGGIYEEWDADNLSFQVENVILSSGTVYCH